MIEAWHDAFRQDAEQAIANLLSGRAGVGSGFRLDTPELLFQIFPNRPDMAAERARLDDALLNWLLDMRRNYAVQVNRTGFAVYGKRLCDALVTLQLLDLPRTRGRIREDLEAWLRWLMPLRLAPERDPALECWRLLTRGQADTRHTAAWLRLADDLRAEYLTVALAGLERLPNESDPRKNQILVLQALLRHGVRINPTSNTARAFFNRRFAALRGQHGPFPRGPQHWYEILITALDAFARSGKARKEQELAEHLRSEADKKLGSQRSRKRPAASAPAAREQVEKLIADLDRPDGPLESLAARFFKILEQNHRHAERTGDSYFFTHVLRVLGRRLLRRRGIASETMAQFAFMIERALGWEPTNPLLWMLWGDWFKYQGLEDNREWTLREMVRLFPDDAHSRVELARILERRGENKEAEKWLLAAANNDPNNAHSRVELARLLVRQGKNEQAEKWLQEVNARNPTDEHSRVELSRLLILRGEGHWDEAESLLRDAANGSPHYAPSRVELARLLVRRGKNEEAEKWLREAVTRNPNHQHSRVELSRLLIRRGEDHWDEAERYLREVADRDPNNTASRVVLAALLRRRGRTLDSERIVRRLREMHPTNLKAQQAIIRFVNELDIAVTTDFADGLSIETDNQSFVEQKASEKTAEDAVKTPGPPEFDSDTEEPDVLSPEESVVLSEEVAQKTAEEPVRALGPPEFDSETEEPDVLSPEESVVLSEEVAQKTAEEPVRALGPPEFDPETEEPGVLSPEESILSEEYANSIEAHGSEITLVPPPALHHEEPRQFTARDEVVRRGSLAGEFSRARIAIAQNQTPKIHRIEHEAANGDALAGFYQQWLAPDSAPPPPPHAWAWNACQRWQKAASSDDWKSLEEQFPELSSETTFLSLLGRSEHIEDEDGVPRWLGGIDIDSRMLSSPRYSFMCKGLGRLTEIGSAERDEIALAVMASAAAASPEFAS